MFVAGREGDQQGHQLDRYGGRDFLIHLAELFDALVVFKELPCRQLPQIHAPVEFWNLYANRSDTFATVAGRVILEAREREKASGNHASLPTARQITDTDVQISDTSVARVLTDRLGKKWPF